MIILRSLAFTFAFYVLTAICSLCAVWVLLLPTNWVIATSVLWVRMIGGFEEHILGLTWHAEGRENIPEGACIIASKHQSAWETFKVGVLFDGPAVVLKKELLYIPIWGWYLWRAGAIPIDRTRGVAALSAMIRVARRMKAAGRKIVIFPQGTRTVPGEARPYKKGIVRLYEELNLPIVPMALNSGLFWPKHGLKKGGHITVRFLPPIPPGLPRMEMMAELEKRLEEASNRLLPR